MPRQPSQTAARNQPQRWKGWWQAWVHDHQVWLVITHYNRWESKPNIVQCDLDTNHHIVIDENQIWDDAHQSITFRLQLQGVYVNLLFLLRQILTGLHGQTVDDSGYQAQKRKLRKRERKETNELWSYHKRISLESHGPWHDLPLYIYIYIYIYIVLI